MRLLVKNIRTLVTCDDADRVLQDVNLYVEDGVIREIGGPERMVDEVLDGSRMILYPGLVNTHHHLYQLFSRNLPQVQNMELFDWLKNLYEIWKNLDADVVYHSSLVGMTELLRRGCTTCLDHHYVFPAGQGIGLLDAQFAAAGDCGIRFHATRGSMDLGVRDGGLPPDSVVQSVDGILRDSEEAVQKFHDPERFSMRQVALAPCSPFSVSRELLIESAALARSLGVRLHTHLAETKDEEKYTLARFGMRPLEYMESVGWIGADVWYAHGIHFQEDELVRLARTGTGVAHCPVSNMKLSSGIANIPRMLELGVPVGLAVDGSASNDGSDLLAELRTGYLLQRLKASRRAPDGYAFLKIATRGGAALLGRDDIGQIAEGKAADFFMIREDRPELVGATMDPRAMLATVGLTGPVDVTVVNGRVVVSGGRVVVIDEERLAERADTVWRRFLAR